MAFLYQNITTSPNDGNEENDHHHPIENSTCNYGKYMISIVAVIIAITSIFYFTKMSFLH